MDQNGESDTNPMVLDPASPSSSHSRDMLDEPTAPRRNSTDDNDTTRPRKRPAVMAGSEELKENNTGSPQLRHSDASDCSELPAYVADGETSVNETTAGTANRTIQIRAPQTQTGNREVQDLQVNSIIKPDDARKRSLSQSPELPHSLDDNSDTHTLSSTGPEIDIEEVEMGENNNHSYHVKHVDPTADPSDLVNDFEEPDDAINRIASAFEKSDCPIRELENISTAISQFVSKTHSTMERREHLLFTNSELCDSLPTLVDTLLTRNEPFHIQFFERDGLRHVTQFFADFVRLAAVIIQHEASKLAMMALEEGIQLFSEAYLATIASMLRQAHLYQIINHAGFQILDAFPKVIHSFARPEGFLDAFKSLAKVIYQRIPSQPKLSSVVEHLHAVPLAILRTLSILSAAELDIRDMILLYITEFWAILEAAISDILESQTQAVDIRELLNRLDDFGSLAAQIYLLQPSNPKLSSKLCDYMSSSNFSSKMVASIVEWAHKFPFYYKMLCTSRMDIRLRGLTCMTDTLLAVWRDHHLRAWEDAPILRFLVDFLVEHGVLEYIVGPESHSELINRSGNVPAFLIVNRKMTEDLLDCLWQPVMDNKDPRIVKATLRMHQDMMTAMTLEHLASLSRRMSRLSFASFDPSMMNFVSFLSERIGKNYTSEPRQRLEMETMRLGPAPYEMLIRLMRLASEHDENTQTLEIFSGANSELTALAEFGPEGSVRRQILDRCVEDICAKNKSVTGSTAVILAFLRRRPRILRADSPTASEDVEYLVEKFDLAALVVEELLQFTEIHRFEETTSRIRKLRLRLELLSSMLRVSSGCLSKESHAQLWLYLVGEKALGPSERDLGFEFYNTFSSPDIESHPLLDSVYREFFPALDPIYFSPAVLELCKKSLDYLNKSTQLEDLMNEENGEVLQIAGIEQLWRIILNACDEKVATATTSFLVNIYLDSNMIMRSPPKVIEATHKSIVDRCIELLTSSAEELSKQGSADLDKMALDDLVPDKCNQVSRVYHRALDFLDQLVKGFRTRPFYASGVHGEAYGLKGETLNLTLRLCTGSQTTAHMVQMGSQNTGQDLHSKIYRITSAKHRVILSGKELKLTDEPFKLLKDFGFHDKCVVVVYITGGTPTPDSTKRGAGPVQPDIVRHFEALYTLLDLPESLSVKAWYFLSNFPPNDLTKLELLAPETPETKILPPDKPYKSLYSLLALRHCFEEQKTGQNDTTPFLRNSVSRLCNALTSGAIQRPSQTVEARVVVTKEILECLKIILQDSIPEDIGLDILPNLDSFVDCVISIIRTCMDLPYTNFPDVDICITNAVHVLFESCRISPLVWSRFSQLSDLQELVQWLLVNDTRTVVRMCICDAICTLCTKPARSSTTSRQDFATYFWPILCDILSDSRRLTPDNSEQLFYAAAETFQFLGQSSGQSLDLCNLFDIWFRQLRLHEVKTIVGQPKEDRVILGFARLLGVCIPLMRSRGLTPETKQLGDTWHNLLFPDLTFPSHNCLERIPCLHDSTRSELYKLTLDLVVNHQQGLEQIVKLNNDLFPDGSVLYAEYWADRDRWLRASTGRVGLHNLSNTCYLNSLLTQLFMNRSFMNFILRLPVDASDMVRRNSYCLKALFARMQDSFSKGIEPRELVESLRDFAGEPIDPQVQMDVDEFFNLLFDRLESEMPSVQSKLSFRSYYGGHLVQQVKSNECSHISERTEPFSAIQCDIKGKYTLQESLKAYVEGEIMEGDNKYRCTTCDRLVDAVKRTCLKDIPDHLICHLKRFDFDLQTMHRSKINDRFEFPTKLDMKPYTIDHLSSMESGVDDNSVPDEFELVGVLVHTGTAESGHYYSYIRDRLSSVENPSWFEFNDSEVSLFDPSTIPENCYGGSDNISATGYVHPKSFSAYMLFYQRSSSLQSIAFPPSDLQDPSVPSTLRLEILKENEDLIKRHSMFSENYVAFVKELLDARLALLKDSSNDKGDLETLHLALQTFEQICSKAKDFPGWDLLAISIDAFARRSDECSRFFLEWVSEPRIISSLILENPFMAIRSQVTKTILSILDHIRRTNGPLYGLPNNLVPRDRTMLFCVCRGFSNAWNGLQGSTKPWNDYFNTLVEICSWGVCEQEYMLKVGILRKLLEMILIDHISSGKRAELRIENFVKIMNKQRWPARLPAELLQLLMRRCSPFLRVHRNEEFRDKYIQQSPLPLTQDEEHYLKYSPPRNPALVVYNKLLEQTVTVDAMQRLTTNILSGDNAPAEHEFIEELKNTLLNGISVEPAIHAEPYLRCLHSFLAATKSQNYINEIVSKVSEEIPTIGTTGGDEHLQFFQNLWPLDALNRSVKLPIIENISWWAPALVVYHDRHVREATEDFLDQLLFEESTVAPHIIQQAVINLANGLFQFVHKFPQNRQSVDESTFGSVLGILTRCKDVQQDQEQFNSRIEDLRVFIERLVLEEEDDVDLASDDWGCSDIGSDTRDVAHLEEFG